MAADEDDIASFDDDAEVLDDREGASGKRIKKSAAPGVEALFAAFVERSKGLRGAEFERELDGLIDEIVERNLSVVPAGIRDELRDTMRSYLESDPTLSSMVSELRGASRR